MFIFLNMLSIDVKKVIDMQIIGLTGSIGMGKSTASYMLKQFGLPVFDADAAVHDLFLNNKNAIQKIVKTFPEYKNCDGSINVKKLAKDSFFDGKAVKKLENILHPFVFYNMLDFIDYHKSNRSIRIVIDVPLLFETGWDAFCDYVILVHCGEEMQKNRVMLREGMTIEKFSAIKQRQMSESKKLKKADYIVSTTVSLRRTRLRLAEVLEDICVR